MAIHVEECGAATFLDHSNIEVGDDFEAQILKAAAGSQELLILLTPWSIQRHYLWIEFGLFLNSSKRIVGVYTGFTAQEIAAHDGLPVRLKRGYLVNLNEIDQYLKELTERAQTWRSRNG